jgi:aldehyde dehydrogenase (NAD+)
MREDARMSIPITEVQRAYFRTGATLDAEFRRAQLARLREAVVRREGEILDAIQRDLGRPHAESYTVEIATLLADLDRARRHLRAWARPRRQRTPLALFPARSWIRPEPYGSVLVISPWNYPFLLALAPLAAALAAGNCAVVKPSEAAPHTSRLVERILGETFEPAYVAAVQGGVAETQALLAQRFDYCFFTGSARVAKLVMAAAAQHLTPVTLELGGKNPCIVARDADVALAARRIAWGKFINAGQTCIAPDFVLAHQAVKPALVEALARAIEGFYGKDPAASPDYARIVDERHFDRLHALLGEGRVAAGGQADRGKRYIAPTVLDDVAWHSAAMQEEIFGPILPVLGYESLEEVLRELAAKPKPLALYFFGHDRAQQEEVLARVSSGGACINDTMVQFVNLRLPFGGVGESGMGAYHGRFGFDTFSHLRGVVRRANWADPAIRYPPYRTPVALLRRVAPFLF